MKGWGYGIMVSVSVCQVGHPGSNPVCSARFRRVRFYQNDINLSPPVQTTGSPKAVHVLSCLCDNACKGSLAICHKSRASCPISRLLSVLYSLHVLNRDMNMIQTNKQIIESNRGRVWCPWSTILADWTLYATPTNFNIMTVWSVVLVTTDLHCTNLGIYKRVFYLLSLYPTLFLDLLPRVDSLGK